MYSALYYEGVFDSESMSSSANPVNDRVPLDGQNHVPVAQIVQRPNVARKARQPLRTSLGHCSVNNGVELQRIIIPLHLWPQVFEKILFPLVGGEQVRTGSGLYGSCPLARVTLLSRTVLHNFEPLARLPEFYVIWLKL